MSNPIKVNSGVKQGCVLLPMLFVVVLDSIMRVSCRGCRRGIQLGKKRKTQRSWFCWFLAQRLEKPQYKAGWNFF